LARVFMALSLLGYILFTELRGPPGCCTARHDPTGAAAATWLRLGLPAALQTTLEVGVFAAATALAGKLDARSLAAHQVALTSPPSPS